MKHVRDRFLVVDVECLYRVMISCQQILAVRTGRTVVLLVLDLFYQQSHHRIIVTM